MSIRDEIIEFICVAITLSLLLPIISLLTPYFPADKKFGDYITGGLIIPGISILSIGVYVILKKIILRILEDKNKSK